MTLKPWLAALIAAPLLSACLIIDADEGGPVRIDLDEGSAPEAVYAVSFGREGVAARVSSNGCTKKADFVTSVRRGVGKAELVFVRTVEDRCRALLPSGVDLSWSYKELGLSPQEDVRIANPFTRGPQGRSPAG